MSLASSSLQSIGKDREVDYYPTMWLRALMKMSTKCDGNLKEASPPLQGMVVEMGRLLEGAKAKMSSEGQEIILKKREGFLGLGDRMCKDHDQREPRV